MIKVPGLKRLYADSAYGGQCVQAVHAAHPTLAM